MKKKQILKLYAVTLSLTAIAAGCASETSKPVGGEEFRPEGEVKSVHQFPTIQSAAGARADGTLRAAHFDRGDLNSLGAEKLDLMLTDDDASTPLIVYVDVKEDALTDARRDSVRVYLKDRGLANEQVRLEAGPNTGKTFSAADGIAGKKALATGAGVATNPEPTGSPVNK